MNRLASETSPYLRQHADNPVDWYPWGEDAFAAARSTDRPVLLSVGYSSCHWCHVMAHESFEDPETAAVMNRLFVNVKVDREERPDVDAVYMQAVVATTGRGGWPMTVFLTPDGEPFFAGTYFPREPRGGMPSFVQVCEAVDAAWRDRRADVTEQAGRVRDALASTMQLGAPTGTGIDVATLDRAAQQIRTGFDPAWGGFGQAPKFPNAMALDFVAHCAQRLQDPELLGILTTSLDAMAAGGIYDQVGGGFARYSTDRYWLVPHFEKMLYDQALLLRAYTDGWQLTGSPRARRVVEETVEYVQRDLRLPEGGVCAAEDADSEGVEGKFYLWSLGEIEALTGPDAAEAIRTWGVTEQGNFEDPHTGYRGNILHIVDRAEEPSEAIRRARAALLEARSKRTRPLHDDKVLLGWNALWARALAEAGAAFDRPDWVAAARETVQFVLGSLRRPDGRLLRSWQAGRAQHLAVAEDSFALVDALLTLAEVDDPGWLADATAIADDAIELFEDPDDAGFFTVGRDAPPLIVRAKDWQDNAVPSENALAAHSLLRLAALSGDLRYEQRARPILERLGAFAVEHPSSFGYLLVAYERAALPPLEVAIVGAPDDPRSEALRRRVFDRLLPASATLTAEPGHTGTPLLEGRGLNDGKPAAYVCEQYTCRAPITDPAELAGELTARRGPARVEPQ